MRVLVAMSGGVDSSVAAALLIKAGYEVIGITFRLVHAGGTGICCGLEGIAEARSVADKLGIKHYVLDFSRIFKERVIDDFCTGYLRGETPNPCIRCNQYLKFGSLLQWAESLDARFVATGHYARIGPGPSGPALFRARPGAKDQSYVLFPIPLEKLPGIIFPLGSYTKDQTRTLASVLDLPVANKAESQDICFISEHQTYGDYIAEHCGTNPTPGSIIDQAGRRMGTHRGLLFYTVGQRRGLAISSDRPLYVLSIIPEKNMLVVGGRDELMQGHLSVNNMILHEELEAGNSLAVKVQIRYRHRPASAVLTIHENQRASVAFTQKQWAITPGQAAVFYRDDRVIGGGWIERQSFISPSSFHTSK